MDLYHILGMEVSTVDTDQDWYRGFVDIWYWLSRNKWQSWFLVSTWQCQNLSNLWQQLSIVLTQLLILIEIKHHDFPILVSKNQTEKLYFSFSNFETENLFSKICSRKTGPTKTNGFRTNKTKTINYYYCIWSIQCQIYFLFQISFIIFFQKFSLFFQITFLLVQIFLWNNILSKMFLNF